MRILLLLMRFPYLINGAFTPPDGKKYFRPPTQTAHGKRNRFSYENERI